MAFPWVIATLIAGFAASHFWKEIKEWASLILGNILDMTNKTVEVTSNAFVYLIKRAASLYVKRIEVGVQNIYTDQTRIEYEEEPVQASVSEEMKAQLKQRSKLKLMETVTKN